MIIIRLRSLERVLQVVFSIFKILYMCTLYVMNRIALSPF